MLCDNRNILSNLDKQGGRGDAGNSNDEATSVHALILLPCQSHIGLSLALSRQSDLVINVLI